jgi:hypothetical protein
LPLVKNPIRRERLRIFLENLLKENSEALQAKNLKPLIQQAVEGLAALDYGEVHALFARGKKRGGYTLRKLRMQALGFADLLIPKNAKGDDDPAIRTVADAYGEHAPAFRKWRTRSKVLGKTADPLMNSFRTEIATRHDWGKTRALAELKKAGETYQKLKKLSDESKKQSKKQSKSTDSSSKIKPK